MPTKRIPMPIKLMFLEACPGGCSRRCPSGRRCRRRGGVKASWMNPALPAVRKPWPASSSRRGSGRVRPRKRGRAGFFRATWSGNPDVPALHAPSPGDPSGVPPALISEIDDLTFETGESLLNSMPVLQALLLHDSLIVALGCLPASRECRTNLKRSDVIGANKSCRQQRCPHAALHGFSEAHHLVGFDLVSTRPAKRPDQLCGRPAIKTTRLANGAVHVYALLHITSEGNSRKFSAGEPPSRHGRALAATEFAVDSLETPS